MKISALSLLIVSAFSGYGWCADQVCADKKIISDIQYIGKSEPGAVPVQQAVLRVTFANGLKIMNWPDRNQIEVIFPDGIKVAFGRTYLSAVDENQLVFSMDYNSGGVGVLLRQYILKRAYMLGDGHCGFMRITSFLGIGNRTTEVGVRIDGGREGDNGSGELSDGRYIMDGQLITPFLYRRWLVDPNPTLDMAQKVGYDFEGRLKKNFALFRQENVELKQAIFTAFSRQ